MRVYPDSTADVNIAGKFQAQNVGVGWQSPDGEYKLVAVIAFVPPANRVTIGNPSYAFNGGGNVVETYATAPAPLNVIQVSDFIGRWTTAEYTLLMQKRAQAITAGTNGPMLLVKQWDMAIALGAVNLNTQAALDFRAALVSAAILTQARADVIFS